jgi:hypothetical protein
MMLNIAITSREGRKEMTVPVADCSMNGKVSYVVAWCVDVELCIGMRCFLHSGDHRRPSMHKVGFEV